jgi:hypothetical protein
VKTNNNPKMDRRYAFEFLVLRGIWLLVFLIAEGRFLGKSYIMQYRKDILWFLQEASKDVNITEREKAEKERDSFFAELP